MNHIETLYALAQAAGPEHFDNTDDTAKFLNAWIDLAPELVALWEAVEKETQGCGLAPNFIPVESIKALHVLNAKAEEVLK